MAISAPESWQDYNATTTSDNGFASLFAAKEFKANVKAKGDVQVEAWQNVSGKIEAGVGYASQGSDLPANKPEPFLQPVGIMTVEGKIKSDMHSKFRQINEYLRLVEQTGVLQELRSEPVHVVDFGCGNAYLTFATYHYLTNVLGHETKMVGIDVQSNLLQKHSANAESLGWANLSFEASTILDYAPDVSPEVVLALHACDTATDDAIAQGIKWRSKLIVTAPCCHHELQEQLHSQSFPVPFKPVARYGILGERWKILTDTFRALILRIMGYRTDVVQFVSSEHTAKNLMIRAVGGLPPGDQRFVREYDRAKGLLAGNPVFGAFVR